MAFHPILSKHEVRMDGSHTFSDGVPKSALQAITVAIVLSSNCIELRIPLSSVVHYMVTSVICAAKFIEILSNVLRINGGPLIERYRP